MAAIAACLLIADAHAEDSAESGVLVLRNGNVLDGVIRQDGEYYRVVQAGATLQVPAAQVEMACRSIDEAYELRRHARAGASADGRLELAEWCLRHDLLDQAARELVDVRTIDPQHPVLARLDLRLRQRLELQAGRAARDAAKTEAAGESASVVPEDAVDKVAFTELLNPSVATQTGFVRRIQPMLVHGCAAGGCHQAGGPQQLQLDRWALEGKGNATLIRRNLSSVLGQINKDHPPSSPLLHWARQVHGVRNQELSRPLTPYQAALLLEWLNEAAGYKAPVEVSQGAPDSIDEGSAGEASGDADYLEMSAEPSDYGTAGLEGREAATLPPRRGFRPRDPFDPEIFNRRVAAKLREAAAQRAVAVESSPAAEAADSLDLQAPAAATEELPVEQRPAE